MYEQIYYAEVGKVCKIEQCGRQKHASTSGRGEENYNIIVAPSCNARGVTPVGSFEKGLALKLDGMGD